MQSARFLTPSRRTLARLAAPGLGLAALALLGVASAPAAHAQGYTLATLASFSGGNGQDPFAGLTLSADGSTLYGTTEFGGANGDGNVFSLTLPAAVPEASTTVSFGLLLALGLGGMVVAAPKKKAGTV